MDPRRFDTFARSLTEVRSRRGALATLLGGTLGLLGLAETAAKKKGNGKKKKKKNRTPSPLPPPPTDPSAPPSTCSDGIKNGSESDVDCGGSCPRCANGKNCNGRDDCTSAFCANGECQACTLQSRCGIDANGGCSCDQPADGGPKVCDTAIATGGPVTSCTSCPTGTSCFVSGASFVCIKLCGAP